MTDERQLCQSPSFTPPGWVISALALSGGHSGDPGEALSGWNQIESTAESCHIGHSGTLWLTYSSCCNFPVMGYSVQTQTGSAVVPKDPELVKGTSVTLGKWWLLQIDLLCFLARMF